MARKRPNNIFDRHQNKRALAKKERAKSRHFGTRELTSEDSNKELLSWKDIDNSFEKELEVSGTVVEVRGGIFLVLYEDEVIECKLDKKIPFQLGRQLVVGDNVYFELEDESGVIRSRLIRENNISRLKKDSTRFSTHNQEEQIVVANIDVGVIVATTMNPVFQPNLIDRYLIIMQNGNVKPLICLNKCDLTDERHPILSYYQSELGINVIEVSAQTGEGMLELQNNLKDKMSVLLGNSGVGKTSIINYLDNELGLKTGKISDKHKEGRHTTTTTTLHRWSPNSYIIDTPGIRSLEIDNIYREDLAAYFPEFDSYALECRYNDCTHDHEPESDCGVKKAVESGLINKERYASYKRMIKDLV